MSKYKVGDKVVYEVKEIIRDGVYLLSGWKESEPLSTYTEPLERKNENKQKQIEKLVDKLHRQAAEITRLLVENEKLKAENGNVIWEIEQAFDRGCNAAWELVRKIFDMETSDIEDIFVTEDAWNLGTVLNNYTYAEAAAKVAEWEKAKEEIKVGDIVKLEKLCGIVMRADESWVIGLTEEGDKFQWSRGNCTKTGRHIDIDSFLKQIRGEQE